VVGRSNFLFWYKATSCFGQPEGACGWRRPGCPAASDELYSIAALHALLGGGGLLSSGQHCVAVYLLVTSVWRSGNRFVAGVERCSADHWPYVPVIAGDNSQSNVLDDHKSQSEDDFARQSGAVGHPVEPYGALASA